MIDYKLEFEDGEIVRCDCCDCEVPTALFQKPIHAQPDHRKPTEYSRFCEVCSSTYISLTYTYSSLHGYDRLHLVRCLAQCTNMILTEIRQQEEKAVVKNRTGVLLNWLWKVTLLAVVVWGLVK